MSAAREMTLSFAADHPAFAGHFPGAPLVPGALLLDEVALRLTDASAGPVIFSRVKFRRAVLPDTTVTLRSTVRADGSHAFALHDGAGAVVVDGIVTAHA